MFKLFSQLCTIKREQNNEKNNQTITNINENEYNKVDNIETIQKTNENQHENEHNKVDNMETIQKTNENEHEYNKNTNTITITNENEYNKNVIVSIQNNKFYMTKNNRLYNPETGSIDDFVDFLKQFFYFFGKPSTIKIQINKEENKSDSFSNLNNLYSQNKNNLNLDNLNNSNNLDSLDNHNNLNINNLDNSNDLNNLNNANLNNLDNSHILSINNLDNYNNLNINNLNNPNLDDIMKFIYSTKIHRDVQFLIYQSCPCNLGHCPLWTNILKVTKEIKTYGDFFHFFAIKSNNKYPELPIFYNVNINHITELPKEVYTPFNHDIVFFKDRFKYIKNSCRKENTVNLTDNKLDPRKTFIILNFSKGW